MVQCTEERISPMPQAMPISLETPKVWASAALTTPVDEAVRQAMVPMGSASLHFARQQMKALKSTSLVYCVVITTYHTEGIMYQGTQHGGRQIYKLIKCGSREAAIMEAFHAAGMNGWNVAFSCVMRLGEDFEERCGKAKQIERLWELGLEEHAGDEIRVFY